MLMQEYSYLSFNEFQVSFLTFQEVLVKELHVIFIGLEATIFNTCEFSKSICNEIDPSGKLSNNVKIKRSNQKGNLKLNFWEEEKKKFDTGE